MFSISNKSMRKAVHFALLVVILLTLVITAIPKPTFASNLVLAQCAVKHTVAAGETLSIIAGQYGVTVQEIIAVNDFDDPNMIFIGQVICIPEGATNLPGDGDEGDADTGKPAGPNFDVTFEGINVIRIKVFNYPRQRSQIVKAGEWNRSWAKLETVVVDRFRTDKNGNADITVGLPENLWKKPIVVCLKNPFTDKIHCDIYSPFID